MVLSGSKRTTYMSSIVNQNSGGGPKKAGLPYQIGRQASVSVAFRNTSQNLTFLRGRRAVLEQILMFATQRLAKATAIKADADALVTATTAAGTADGATQADIDAYDAAGSAASIAGTNVSTEEGKVSDASTALVNYTPAV